MNLRKVFALLLTVLPAVCWSQTQKIRGGSTVYIDSMGGYENYLEAAFTKEHVPLIVVDDKAKARYIITSTVAHQDFSSDEPTAMDNNRNAVVVNENVAASIALFDPRVSRILFAYAAREECRGLRKAPGEGHSKVSKMSAFPESRIGVQQAGDLETRRSM
jgi:hypothetical protein